MVKIDLDNLINDTELSYTKFSAKVGVSSQSILVGRKKGEVSEKLAFKLMEIFPKLYKKYKG